MNNKTLNKYDISLYLEDYFIPEGIVSIEKNTFCNHKELTHVSLPNSLKEIGENCFKESNIKWIIIPEGVTEIKDNAFYKCTELKLISLPTSLQRIGNYAFAYTNIEFITIPNNVSIGKNILFGCKNLKKIYCNTFLKNELMI